MYAALLSKSDTTGIYGFYSLFDTKFGDISVEKHYWCIQFYPVMIKLISYMNRNFAKPKIHIKL